MALPKQVEKKAYHTRNIDTQQTLNMEQVLTLIEASRETPIHMQVLFAVLLGLRRCEINGVKYSDINYINRTLKVQRQLGKKPNTTAGDFPAKTFTKQEIGLKRRPATEPSPYRIMCLKPFWKKEKCMRRTAEGGQAHFRIWIISAVPPMGVREARIFTGGIIRSCWRTMDCPI